MARLPRLPPAAEHRLVKFVCGLSPRVQRLLFGAPPVLDGQRLAEDIHALLWLDRLVSDDGFSKSKEVEETRAERLKEARIVAARPPVPMEQVKTLELPGPTGVIGARFYVPPQPAREPLPLLVYYHGGGWVIGDLETHDDPCRFLATHSGAAVLAVDYRLAPEHPFPAAPEDALAAYEWA
ncbi:MAG TPA: alpha/beta hydrolase, partial [Solirubrobacterales bacterium]|nr:alpha/beta hydrolase [Solirubrobacterales bacterium]